MLIVPLLALTPVYLRNRSPWLAALLGFLLARRAGDAVTQRSGRARRRVPRAARALPTASSSRARSPSRSRSWRRSSSWIVSRRADFFVEVIRSRIATGDASTSAHFDVYGFIPDVLAAIRSSGSA